MNAENKLSITLPITPGLVAGFGAVLQHAAKDAVAPVIQSVRVTMRHIIATDRYTIGQYEHTTYDESVERYGEDGPADPDAAITLPRDVAEWLSKYKVSGLQILTLTLTEDRAIITWENDAENIVESRAFKNMSALNYPPVARLIPEVTEGAVDVPPLYLGADLLARVAKSAQIIQRVSRQKNAPVRMQFAPSESRYRHDPVLVTIGRLTMLIQPSIP
jgi:hypothetical protein